MTLVRLGDTVAARATLAIPSWGAWWLDVDLVDPLEVARGANVTATFAGLTLSGTVLSGDAYEGRASYRIVGGRGRWGSTIPRRGYRNDLGVRAADVVTDAATAAGEVVDVAGLAGRRLGPHYTRAEGPAFHALALIAPRAYRVDLDGVTRFGARPIYTLTGDAPRTAVRPAAGVVELAVESAVGILPGAIVSPADLPATDVEFRLEGQRLTAKLYAGARQRNRRLAALERILDALDPGRRYRAVYEYRVVEQSGERYHLQPARVASGMPDLLGVPVRGAAGVRAAVRLGSLVVVAFLDGDPSRPSVIAHDAAGEPGWMPQAVKLGLDPVLGVARRTDPVLAGFFTGTITGASATIGAGS